MKKYAIISLHNGSASEILQTCKSIDMQVTKVDLHLVISKTSFFSTNLIKKKNRIIILCKDNSIYEAMNMALKLTTNYNISFLNSGDKLSNNFAIYYLKRYFYKNQCLQLKTILNYKNIFFHAKKKYFDSKMYKIHPSFIRPSLKFNKSNILFSEKSYFYADIEWMNKNEKIFGLKKIDKNFSIHKLGGVSTNPTLKTVYNYFKKSKYLAFKEFLKLLIKYIFFKSYYKIIYSKKFELKSE
jgi:hypothetical protein